MPRSVSLAWVCALLAASPGGLTEGLSCVPDALGPTRGRARPCRGVHRQSITDRGPERRVERGASIVHPFGYGPLGNGVASPSGSPSASDSSPTGYHARRHQDAAAVSSVSGSPQSRSEGANRIFIYTGGEPGGPAGFPPDRAEAGRRREDPRRAPGGRHIFLAFTGSRASGCRLSDLRRLSHSLAPGLNRLARGAPLKPLATGKK